MHLRGLRGNQTAQRRICEGTSGQNHVRELEMFIHGRETGEEEKNERRW